MNKRMIERFIKTYIVCSDTNYDLFVQIINAKTKAEALRLALKNGAWGGCRVTEIDTNKKGIVFQE